MPIADLFDSDKIMELLRDTDEHRGPQWLVPVIFHADDEESAFRIKDTIEMLVKSGALQFADLTTDTSQHSD